MILKRILSVLLMIILAMTLLVGCSGGAKKKLVVGLDDNFPPMGFRDEKNVIVGFDIDMATEAAKRMGRDVEFKPIDWSAKEAELTGKRVDLLWNGLTITDKRKEVINFTKPYMENRQIIIVEEKSTIKTKADLAGKVIGLQDGSSSLEALGRDTKTKATIKSVKAYADNVTALMDLKSGRIEAVIVDEVVGRYYAKKSGQHRILDENFGTEDYGVGVRKEDKELLAALQKAFDEMKKDGTSAKISTKWFGVDIVK